MTPADLPLLLAGPIIRRCQADQVWLWLATSKKPDAVVASIFEHTFDRGKHDPLWGRSGVPTRGIKLATQSSDDLRVARLGAHLFVILVRIRPYRGKFPNGFLRYDLEITIDGTTRALNELTVDLSIEKVDTGVKYLFAGFPRPFFRLPEAGAPITQGSCRRPGARGWDAFIHLDEWIEKNPRKLPQALFLTGDQIYADWVAPQLFDSVRELAPIVFGVDEPLPYNGKQQGVSSFAFKKRKAVVNGRSPFGDKWGFTTQDDGHLLGFSEFAAMYLLAWNPILCRKLGVDQGKDEKLEDYAIAVAAARRVMAHLPTYMVFDDHEITDDWYFNTRWKTANLLEAFTRAIIANGLAAYWAFQAWGNAPDSFSRDFKEAIELHLTRIADTGRLDSDAMGKYQKELFNFKNWSFFAPTTPPALFIDTRTQREMSSRTETAVLIGRAGQQQLLDKSREAGVGMWPDVLLLVLPGPLLAWKPAAIGQLIGSAYANAFGAAGIAGGGLRRYGVTLDMLDNEWEEFWNNPDGILNVVDAVSRIAPRRGCVVFSGDVHFSYCVDAKFVRFSGPGDTPEDRGRFIQITSSPMLNVNSQFDTYTSKANIAERNFPKKIDDVWDWNGGFYAVNGAALPLVNGGREGRTSLPDNNICLVTFERGLNLHADFLALSLTGSKRRFSRRFAL